jgi:hypothetical protein
MIHGDVIIGERWQILGLCSAFRAFDKGGIFIVLQCCTGPRFFRSHPKNPHLVAFCDRQLDTEDLYNSNPEPHLVASYDTPVDPDNLLEPRYPRVRVCKGGTCKFHELVIYRETCKCRWYLGCPDVATYVWEVNNGKIQIISFEIQCSQILCHFGLLEMEYYLYLECGLFCRVSATLVFEFATIRYSHVDLIAENLKQASLLGF